MYNQSFKNPGVIFAFDIFSKLVQYNFRSDLRLKSSDRSFGKTKRVERFLFGAYSICLNILSL